MSINEGNQNALYHRCYCGGCNHVYLKDCKPEVCPCCYRIKITHKIGKFYGQKFKKTVDDSGVLRIEEIGA